MMEFDQEKVRRKACPQCGASAGAPCRTRTGKRYTGDFHVRRKGAVYPSFLHDAAGKPKRGIRKADAP